MKQLLAFIILLSAYSASGQFAPQAGVSGSTAISAKDNRIVGWASGCTVTRGWLNIADKSKGFTTLGTDASGTGPRDIGTVSLGDSGVAVLTFAAPIYNGMGADFAVFENGFANPADPEEAFLELAFVEVSSDSVNYVRFPATCLLEAPQIPGAGVYSNARKINNLAGKYISGYGTPFDLEELKDSTAIDINNITHVRIVDAIGALESNSSIDKDGNKINDPYPTEFPSGGFDLDAVAALYMKGRFPSDVSRLGHLGGIQLYPNPVSDVLRITLSDNSDAVLSLIDLTGEVLFTQSISGHSAELNVRNFASGTYFILITDKEGNQWRERFMKY